MNIPSRTLFTTVLKNGVLTCLKLSAIFGVLFAVAFNSITLKGIAVSIGVSALYCFGLGLGTGILNYFLSKKWDWIKDNKQRIWAGIIGTILYTVPVVLLLDYLVLVLIFDNSHFSFFSGQFLWIHISYISIAFCVSTFLHAKEFMNKWKRAMTKETTKQEIVAKTETAKFETLKNQLDPHFLFNSLNVLTSLIDENPRQAEKFTTKLSKVYRYVLEQRNKELIPLSEELTFANTYMELLSMRFEEAVKFEIPKSVSDSNYKIVPLSLQLLLENAVKHNVVSNTKPLHIRIFEQDGYLMVENNINPKEALGKGTHVGLRNIADRYGLITSKNVIIENNNKIFKVCLPLLTKSNEIMNSDNIENSKYVRAVERVEKLKELYQNIAAYVIVIPFLIFINLRFSPQFKWFFFPMIGWGIGIIFHWLEVSNYNIFLGRNWEERKIKEYMDQHKNKL